jgi:hypothetical protein
MPHGARRLRSANCDGASGLRSSSSRPLYLTTLWVPTSPLHRRLAASGELSSITIVHCRQDFKELTRSQFGGSPWSCCPDGGGRHEGNGSAWDIERLSAMPPPPIACSVSGTNLQGVLRSQGGKSQPRGLVT